MVTDAPVFNIREIKEITELRAVEDLQKEIWGCTDREILPSLTLIPLLDVGGVLINNVPTFRVENMPYGGVKDSGFGREGIRYAMEEMTEVKSLIFKLGQ